MKTVDTDREEPMQAELLEDHLRAHPEGTPLEAIARDILKLDGPDAIVVRIAEAALAATPGVFRGGDGLYRWDGAVKTERASAEDDERWLERARARRKAELEAEQAAAEAAARVPVIDAETGERIEPDDDEDDGGQAPAATADGEPTESVGRPSGGRPHAQNRADEDDLPTFDVSELAERSATRRTAETKPRSPLQRARVANDVSEPAWTAFEPSALEVRAVDERPVDERPVDERPADAPAPSEAGGQSPDTDAGAERPTEDRGAGSDEAPDAPAGDTAPSVASASDDPAVEPREPDASSVAVGGATRSGVGATEPDARGAAEPDARPSGSAPPTRTGSGSGLEDAVPDNPALEVGPTDDDTTELAESTEPAPSRVVVLVAKATDRHPSTGALVEVGAVEIAGGQISRRGLATAVRPPRPLPEALCRRLGIDPRVLEDGMPVDEVLQRLAPMLDGARVVCLGSDRGAVFLRLALRAAGHGIEFDGEPVLLWPVLREAGLVGARVDLEEAASALDVMMPEPLDTGRLVAFMAELVLAAVDRGVSVARLAPRPRFDFDTVAFDEGTLARIPDAPGIYRFVDRSGALLYVGKARRLRQRVASYFGHRAQRRKRYTAMVEALWNVTWEETGSELEALLAELRAIREECPRFNVQIGVAPEGRPRLEGHHVLFLPSEGARESESEGGEGDRVALIFIGAGRMIGHIHAHRDGRDSRRVREAVRRAFFIDRPATEVDAAETAVVASWVSRHRDRHSALDVSDAASLDDAVRLVQAYVGDDALFRERVVHR